MLEDNLFIVRLSVEMEVFSVGIHIGLDSKFVSKKL